MSNEKQLQEESEAILFAGGEPVASPKTNADFNRRTLHLWVSGRDFEPLPRQIKRRLGWMALPFIAGLLLMPLVLPHLMRSNEPAALTTAPLPETTPTRYWVPPALPPSPPSPILRSLEAKPADQPKEVRHAR